MPRYISLIPLLSFLFVACAKSETTAATTPSQSPQIVLMALPPNLIGIGTRTGKIICLEEAKTDKHFNYTCVCPFAFDLVSHGRYHYLIVSEKDTTTVSCGATVQPEPLGPAGGLPASNPAGPVVPHSP